MRHAENRLAFLKTSCQPEFMMRLNLQLPLLCRVTLLCTVLAFFAIQAGLEWEDYVLDAEDAKWHHEHASGNMNHYCLPGPLHLLVGNIVQNGRSQIYRKFHI
jgi:hypothetical protein